MTLTRKEVIYELKKEIKNYAWSYKEQDGVIRNTDALRMLQALRQAVAIVRRSHE